MFSPRLKPWHYNQTSFKTPAKTGVFSLKKDLQDLGKYRIYIIFVMAKCPYPHSLLTYESYLRKAAIFFDP